MKIVGAYTENCAYQVAERLGENQGTFSEGKTEITLGMKFVGYN